MSTHETIHTNARIVTPTSEFIGTVVIRDGLIAELDEGVVAAGEDWGGDYLIPGLVELHTDHLDTHYSPRPGVVWNSTSALQAHDAQIAGSGITTVFDCFQVGNDAVKNDFEEGDMRHLARELRRVQDEGRLRADHKIHLRCEVSSPIAVEEYDAFDDDPEISLASLMDHAPGQRQFQTMDQYTLYYKTKRGLSDKEFERFVNRRLEESAKYSASHRSYISERCRQRGCTLASHDDATLAHVDEAIAAGVRLAEFPTSMEAAKASHENGLSVLMGAPNVVRGKSHSGNIAAIDLARAECLDVLSSDYVPASLLHAPFHLADTLDNVSLPQALRMVTETPARAVGLNDRGSVEVGKRADLVRVSRPTKDVPVVRSVWRQGKRVA